MANVNYLDNTDLSTDFSTGMFDSHSIDAVSQGELIQQLIAEHLVGGYFVSSDIFNGIVQPPLFGNGGDATVTAGTEVLEIQQYIANVETNSDLKAIIDDDSNHGAILNVIGGTDPVYVALGFQGTMVGLNDHGADTVQASGQDTITGNDGDDVLKGDGQSTLVAGSGNDTLDIHQGDTALLPVGTMVASGNDVYNIENGSGSSTINLGTGADTVNFTADGGFDTINLGTGPDIVNFFTDALSATINHAVGGGTDTINFADHSFADLLPGAAGITPGSVSGDYTLNFTNGVSVALNGSNVSSTENAFVLKFDDGTIKDLKGGS